MTDIVHQLRTLYQTHPLVMKAAQRIEAHQHAVAKLLDLLQPLANSVDEQTHDRRAREAAPEDRGYVVVVTARQERALGEAVCMLEMMREMQATGRIVAPTLPEGDG